MTETGYEYAQLGRKICETLERVNRSSDILWLYFNMAA